MDYDLMARVAFYFAKAAWVTVEVSFLSLCLGLGLGLTAALCKLSPNCWLQIPARIYVSVFRGTPCLIQLFVIYFGGPQIGLQLEPFAAGVLGLGLSSAATYSDLRDGNAWFVTGDLSRRVGRADFRGTYQLYRSAIAGSVLESHTAGLAFTVPLAQRVFASIRARSQFGAHIAATNVYMSLWTTF